MAFRQTNFARLAKFNSAASCDFIEMYEKYVEDKIASKNAEPKNKTFAPSSFRCPRISWFRLRGTQPDSIPKPDKTLDFTAQIGTACHEIIQRNLSDLLGEDWIDVGTYLQSIDTGYEYTVEKNGYETKIEIKSPPVRFACDGIIRINGEYYLLEIKTSEYISFDQLTDPKEQHVDQIKCYAALLKIKKVLVLYQDRQYGGLKCYQLNITDADIADVMMKFDYIQMMAEANLAPERLPNGDPWCTSNHCPYYKVCKQWG